MRRLLPALAVLALLLGACGSRAGGSPDPSPAACTPPPGGRCAGDEAWRGPIQLAPDGRTLHGIVLCGGTLDATESAGRVDLRLHVGAIGPGGMMCARARVSVRLSEPLGGRPVYDAVSGDRIAVVRAQG